MSDVAPPAVTPLHRVAWQVIVLATVGVAAATLSALLADHFVWLIAIMVGAGLGLAMLRRTEVATLLVTLMLVTNVPVVAVKFHSVPKVIGALLPALLILPLLDLLIRRRQAFVVPTALPWVLLYLLVQCVGVVCAVKPEEATAALVVFLAEGLAVYWVFANLIRTPQMFRATAIVLLLAGVLMGGLPVLQQLTGTHDRNYGGFAQMGERGFTVGEDAAGGAVTQARSSGPIGEKNRYAQIMLMLVPIGVFLAGYEQRGRDRLLAMAATLICAAGMILAFSRGAIVGVGMTFMAATGLGYLQRKHLVALVLGGVLLLALFPQYWGRIASLSVFGQIAAGNVQVAAEADGAVRGRATEMGAAALVFLDHPLVGVGPGMFKYYAIEYGERIGLRTLQENREAHCLYLDVAAQSGILGLGALLAAVGTVLYRLHLARKSLLLHNDVYLGQFAAALMLMVIAYMTTGIFLHFAYIRYFWLMLGICEALIAYARFPAVPLACVGGRPLGVWHEGNAVAAQKPCD